MHWESLDLDLSVPGLLILRVCRTRVAGGNGRIGGQRTSAAKTAAARRNWRKGGRPHSRTRVVRLKDAKAKLSTVVDEAVRGKPSVITRHGKREVVVLSYADWERLSRIPSFGRLLMSAPLQDADLPGRSKTPVRRVDL